MSAGGAHPMTLATAEKLAGRIAAELQMYCEHIEAVGSIRRRRPLCNDIDFAVLLRPGALVDFRRRALANAQAIRDGDECLGVRLANGVAVEFYFARRAETDLIRKLPGTLGLVRLLRTGSKEHNIKLAQQAKRLGLHLNTTFGVFGPKGWKPNLPVEVRAALVAHQYATSECLAAATEEEIFTVLKLDFVQPEEREVWV